uniref:Uncharacterized protein n=1 Tax=Oryza meridionalis TaxID=40149 RepID=A0A0E0C3B0_9ORYZ
MWPRVVAAAERDDGLARRRRGESGSWQRRVFTSDRVKKTDSRPPRQHDKYPLDGAVFIGKYPRLWDVFPQNFTSAVSLS